MRALRSFLDKYKSSDTEVVMKSGIVKALILQRNEHFQKHRTILKKNINCFLIFNNILKFTEDINQALKPN